MFQYHAIGSDRSSGYRERQQWRHTVTGLWSTTLTVTQGKVVAASLLHSSLGIHLMPVRFSFKTCSMRYHHRNPSREGKQEETGKGDETIKGGNGKGEWMKSEDMVTGTTGKERRERGNIQTVNSLKLTLKAFYVIHRHPRTTCRHGHPCPRNLFPFLC